MENWANDSKFPKPSKMPELQSVPFVLVFQIPDRQLIVGSVRTNLANNSPGGWLGVFAARVFMFLFSREPGYAARTIVHAAVSSEGREYRGDFLLDFDVQKYDPDTSLYDRSLTI